MESKYGYIYLHPPLLWNSVEDDCLSAHMFISGWGSSGLHTSARCSITNGLVMSSWNRGSNERVGHWRDQCLFFCWWAISTTSSWGGVGRCWVGWWASTWVRRLVWYNQLLLHGGMSPLDLSASPHHSLLSHQCQQGQPQVGSWLSMRKGQLWGGLWLALSGLEYFGTTQALL